MAKPILRLGPVNELDDEFDPLLGRSVRDEPTPVAASFAKALDPDQSVFDEPEPVTDPQWTDTAPEGPAVHAPTQPDQPSLLDWMESPTQATPPAPEPEPEPEPEPAIPSEALLDQVTDEDRTFKADMPLNDPSSADWPTDDLSDEVALDPADADDHQLEEQAWPEAPLEAPSPEDIPSALREDIEPAPEWIEPTQPEDGITPAMGRFASAPEAAQRVHRPPGASRAAQRRAKLRRSPIGRRKAEQKLAATIIGTGLFAVALFFTLLSFLAPLGYPFDAASSYRWYWTLIALGAGLSWALVRGRNMMIASGLIGLINLMVILPSLGSAPKGGKISTAVVAWANVAGDETAFEKVLLEAERQKAGLVMIASAPQKLASMPPGWRVIEQPNPADPTSIAVLSRGLWQSATIPGEPTIARTAAGDLTIIATMPASSKGGSAIRAARQSQLNRAAVRAGDQEGPIAVLGDFGVAPWDGAMGQFRKYGNVTRVRCGGFMGATMSSAFGLIGVAHDHAYVREVKVTHCRLGAPLPTGGHRALYLYLAPLDAPK